MKGRIKEYCASVSITVILLAVSFLLHLKWCGSPLTAPHDLWQRRIDAHLIIYPFSLRFFTTYTVLLLSKVFQLPFRESFYILQFGLALIIGPVFYNYLKGLKFNKVWSNVGVFILFSSYPIMAAHFEPVHTWDDFWAYLFLILSLAAVVKGNLLQGVVYFTLGCFAREQTAVFYPILVLAIIQLKWDISKLKRIAFLLLPVLVYGAFYLCVRQPYSYHLLFNFENALRIRDSIFSIFISFGFVWVGSCIAIIQLAGKKKSAVDRFLIWSSLISVILNLVFVLFFGRARETRLLFPPFVFLIPLTLLILKPSHEVISKYLRRSHKVILLLVFHGLMMGGILLAKQIFPSFEYRQCVSYCLNWTGINLGIIAVLTLLHILHPKAGEECANYEAERLKSESSSNSWLAE